MSDIVMFHHVQGLTEGLHAFADTLRAAGHTVHPVDTYDGRTFADFDEGLAHAQSLGFGALMEAAVTAAEDLPTEVVYVGWSLGVMPAQRLAQTRPGARGAVLISACLPASEFGPESGPTWPIGVPVQVHGMERDPIFADDGDLDAARDLVSSTESAELFLYPGDQHLFADPSLLSYDGEAAQLLTRRVLDLLG